VVGLLTDISTKKQQESLLKKKNEELVSTNKDLEDFVSVASHDLQEPLRKIRTNCDILKDQIDPKDSSIMTLKTLDFICASTKRMQALITSLLNYSKLEHQGCHLEPVDLNLALKESLETLSLKINETQSSIVCPSRLPTIMAEKTSSSMLFKNLIENAIKYRSQNETPEITISTLEKKDNWEIAIHDNGIGIDVKHHEDVFKIFQRLHNKKDYPGTGLSFVYLVWSSLTAWFVSYAYKHDYHDRFYNTYNCKYLLLHKKTRCA